MMVVLTFIASPCANSPSHISPPLLLVGGCPGRLSFCSEGGLGGHASGAEHDAFFGQTVGGRRRGRGRGRGGRGRGEKVAVGVEGRYDTWVKSWQWGGKEGRRG